MELPAGMELEGCKSSDYVLSLKVSLYGLKQASANWHNKLKTALEDRGFVESLSDPCVYIRKDMMVLEYVGDCILIAKGASVIDEFITSLTDVPRNVYSLMKAQ
jgi:hypothetical protein